MTFENHFNHFKIRSREQYLAGQRNFEFLITAVGLLSLSQVPEQKVQLNFIVLTPSGGLTKND